MNELNLKTYLKKIKNKMKNLQGTLFDLPTDSDIEVEPVLPPIVLDGFRQVSYDEYWETIGNLNAVVYTVGNFPYTSEWKLRNGNLIGKSVDSYGFEFGKYIVTRYYISCNWQSIKNA